MFHSFTANGKRRWIDNLQSLVDGYNDKKHSSTEFKPNEVDKRNEHLVCRILFPKIVKKKIHTKPVFKVGDTVRIARKKYTFQKGYEETFSYEVFQIAEIKENYPVTYGIQDFKDEVIKGSFYKN